jgi:putative ABC transport system permease protein
MSKIKIPKLPFWLMQFIADDNQRFPAIGDLEELYFDKVHQKGKFVAWLWIWKQILFSLPHFLIQSFKWSLIMLNNYIKIAFRNIQRQKGYSFINISGLAIGMACCLLIVLFIQDELSYDNFHKNGNRIFRVVTSTSEDGIPTNANGIFATGPALKKDFPDVVDFVRIRTMGQSTRIYIGNNERKFYEDKFFFVDSSFFSVFTFPLLRGDAKKVLSAPHSMVITEAMADKYFGNQDPIGQTLESDPYNSGKLMTFQVTGIAKNVPNNSHFHFDFLASYADQTEDLTRFSGIWSHYTYVLLKDASQAAGLESRLLDFLKRHWRDDPWYTNHLQSLKEIRLHSHLRSEIEPNGNIVSVIIFSIVAILVLVIACLNYINLSTARSLKRAKEVGLRKVVGARRKQLIWQFLGESLLVSFLSSFLAVILTMLFLPLFNTIANKNITLHFLAETIPMISLAAIMVVVGIVSGSYVAFVLSNMTPLKILKDSSSSGGWKKRLRGAMVVFQFFLATVIIISALIADKQMSFIQTNSTGYNRDEILVIPLNKDARANYSALRNELLTYPAIRNTTTSSYVPTRGTMHDNVSFEGKEENITPVLYFIDKEFISTYGIQILYGEDFTNDIIQTTNTEVLISEETIIEAKYSGPEDALGKRIQYHENIGTIKGIIKDMNLYSFHRHVYPIVLFMTPIQRHDYLSIRLDANRYGEALTAIQSEWERLIPDYPFDYFFLNESFEQMHRADQRLGDIFRYFSSMAIIVACMGLFGLALFTAEQRTKEIGMRKVLGATVPNLVFLLSKHFIFLIGLANILAWPLAYFIMDNWLQNFVYRTNISIHTFIYSSLLVVIIALITVSFQTIKAAVANPINSLRYE